ncbi:chorismate mutase [Streptomyces yaizuensis]|uniref:Chorismate mutase n=1 Tax=Streptomyces yaizuensis TaxID=2989713 RepID=A0ABQ5P0L0_9ACTN|nr:chorismate mutase [Streptomyces sp. YSPA8]GLF96146.1 chorismate mutase [Streptomyces sp. YSPA8]
MAVGAVLGAVRRERDGAGHPGGRVGRNATARTVPHPTPGPARKPDVTGAVPRAVRMPAHVESGPDRSGTTHGYLGPAALRKDIAQ